MRTPKNTPGKPNSVPVGSRSAHKGNFTPKAKKTRSTARYFDLKIRLPMADYNRGLPYFEDQKYLVRFMLDAYREKLNRAEANDKAARLRVLAGNIALLEPILKEMFTQGKLNYLFEKNGGEK
jgi:hypothetical protein